MESPDRQDFITAIKELGISDSEVCIHSSMKSFGVKLESGIESLIDVFYHRGIENY